MEHSAILSTFIKLPLSLRSVFYLFLSGRFTQVLQYTVQLAHFSSMVRLCCHQLPGLYKTQHTVKLAHF